MAVKLADPWESAISLAPMKRKISETKLQKKCAEWARDRGWWARKFSSPANRSVPDYLFGHYQLANRAKLAIEFKIWDNVSTEAQWGEQYSMWLAGWQVEECNNFHTFKNIILSAEDSPLSGQRRGTERI